MFKYWKTEDSNYAYFTRGCAANAEEANRLLYLLKPYFPGFILVNSCMLKEKQEKSLMACLEALIERKPKWFPVFITGCSATIHPKRYEKYGKVIPNKDKFDLKAYGVTQEQIDTVIQFPKSDVAMIEVQTGCNSSCTYCIIPKARGKSVSFPYHQIRDGVAEALKQGHKTIRFVGTNLTQYVRREDDGKIYRIADLCERILNEFPNLECLQTDFIEPESLDVEPLIDLMRRNKRFHHHLDLGVQSFCDELLKRMNRRTTKARMHYLYELAGKDVHLVPDIIVGFPGETEEQFQETCQFVKDHNITDVHVHAFSARPGTPAASMPNKVPDEVKNRRSNELRMLVWENKSHEEKERPEDRQRRLVQFELTKQCANGCKFCYNWPDSLNTEEDKVSVLLDAHAFVNSDEMKEYDGVALIGGELFDGQFNTYTERLLFTELFPVILYSLRGKDSELRISSGLMFDDPTFMLNTLQGENMSSIQNFGTIRMCTSYDTMGRFTKPGQLENWERNMKLIHDKFPAIRLHTEIIVTEDFLQKVLSGEFNITEFKKKYHTDVDFLEPNSGFFFDNKETFNKRLPNFFPKRETFMKFLQLMLQTGEIDLHALLDVTQKCDTLFMKINGKMKKITDRNKGCGDLPCNIKEKCGYIDSDVPMRDDVLMILEETY